MSMNIRYYKGKNAEKLHRLSKIAILSAEIVAWPRRKESVCLYPAKRGSGFIWIVWRSPKRSGGVSISAKRGGRVSRASVSEAFDLACMDLLKDYRARAPDDGGKKAP